MHIWSFEGSKEAQGHREFNTRDTKRWSGLLEKSFCFNSLRENYF
jgi:hypothetical protein